MIIWLVLHTNQICRLFFVQRTLSKPRHIKWKLSDRYLPHVLTEVIQQLTVEKHFCIWRGGLLWIILFNTLKLNTPYNSTHAPSFIIHLTWSENMALTFKIFHALGKYHYPKPVNTLNTSDSNAVNICFGSVAYLTTLKRQHRSKKRLHILSMYIHLSKQSFNERKDSSYMQSS